MTRWAVRNQTWLQLDTSMLNAVDGLSKDTLMLFIYSARLVKYLGCVGFPVDQMLGSDVARLAPVEVELFDTVFVHVRTTLEN